MASMKLIAVLMVSLCLIAPLTHATDVTYCTRKGYAVKVHGVEINPNPVIRGEEAKFSISATTVPSAVSRLGMHFAFQLPTLTAPTLSSATSRPPLAVLVSYTSDSSCFLLLTFQSYTNNKAPPSIRKSRATNCVWNSQSAPSASVQ
ncbi:hypothetical protein TIFTF001_008828 [Ficus carica]|uniref:MD-2-related lipid-recognition domain-containing protein n=1 Tax=Ficus carica TaxID=3494 RepID=A0AA87ZU78_FICCA|nr:hypothetical protein TIFTF001_008828 [Ficus carica]